MAIGGGVQAQILHHCRARRDEKPATLTPAWMKRGASALIRGCSMAPRLSHATGPAKDASASIDILTTSVNRLLPDRDIVLRLSRPAAKRGEISFYRTVLGLILSSAGAWQGTSCFSFIWVLTSHMLLLDGSTDYIIPDGGHGEVLAVTSTVLSISSRPDRSRVESERTIDWLTP